MKRLLLCPLASVVMLAGEPAVGGPVEPPPAPTLRAPHFAPLEWAASLAALRGVPHGTRR